MSSCVCKVLFKSEKICGCCCKMLRGSLFWDSGIVSYRVDCRTDFGEWLWCHVWATASAGFSGFDISETVSFITQNAHFADEQKSIDKLSLWLIKLIHVGFRAHVKIASRIVSYQYYYKVSLKLIYRFAIAVDARSVCDSLSKFLVCRCFIIDNFGLLQLFNLYAIKLVSRWKWSTSFLSHKADGYVLPCIPTSLSV